MRLLLYVSHLKSADSTKIHHMHYDLNILKRMPSKAILPITLHDPQIIATNTHLSKQTKGA